MTSTRVLGPYKLPSIGLGCMPLSGLPPSKDWILKERDSAIGVIHAALDAGVRLLDTSDIYAPTWNSVGHNEILVAEAVRSWSGNASQKDEIVIATKGGITRAPEEVIGLEFQAAMHPSITSIAQLKHQLQRCSSAQSNCGNIIASITSCPLRNNLKMS